MISSICWAPKGAARATPIVAEPTEEELEAMKAAALRAQESRGGAGEEDSRLAPSLALHPIDSALLVQGIQSGTSVFSCWSATTTRQFALSISAKPKGLLTCVRKTVCSCLLRYNVVECGIEGTSFCANLASNSGCQTSGSILGMIHPVETISLL